MNFVDIAIQVIVVVFSITFHEFSHALSAYKLGDDTAKRAGRLTLNPISHLDIIGALMLFFVHIGWAKPVPINPYNFKNLKTGTALSAAAGPISNFIIAAVCALIFRFIEAGNLLTTAYNPFLTASIFIFTKIVYYAVFMNLALGLFNLIPLPPLDGSKILGGFLSDEMYFKYTAKEQQGAIILMIIMAVSFIFKIPIFGMIIDAPLQFMVHLFLGN
jgi:Zn-dependent protease